MKITPFLILLSLTPALAAPLTLGEALARVEAQHPWLRTRDATTASNQAQLDAARTAPPAEVSLQIENILGTGELSAGRSAETTLQFSRALDWAGRRSGRIDAAATLGEAEQVAWEERRRDLLAEAARRFIEVAAAQAELNLAREHVTLAEQTTATIQQRAQQAAAAPGDLARARLALTESQLEAEHAEHRLLSSRQSLISLWGAESADFERVEADFTTLPAVGTYEQLAPQLADTLTQARFTAQIRWRLAQEKLARTTAARGESRWTTGLRRTETSNDFGFVFGLNYAWPSTATAGAQLAEVRRERARSEADGAASLNEARATLFGLCQELNHARLEHDAARDEMLPAAQAWLAAVESGMAAGRYGVRDVLEARAALFEAKCRRLAAAADYHTTLVAIEQLLGGAANP